MPGALEIYTTEGISEEDTISAWEDYLARVYYGHLVKPIGRRIVVGSLEKRVFGEIGVSRHRATAHTICRTSDLLHLDKIEQHAFVFPTSGTFVCRQHGREAEVAAGDAFVLNASEPFEVDTTDDAASVAVTVPSAIARSHIKQLDDKCCRERSGEPAFVAGLVGFFDRIVSNGSDVDTLWLRGMCCGLLDAMLSPRLARENEPRWRTSVAARQLLLDTARRTIAERLHQKDFGVVEAASACGVSLRLLQSAFQAAGSTFGEELMAARLERGAQLLRSYSRGVSQIAQIADRCGFTNPAYFSTRYRERYGISPRDETPTKETANRVPIARRDS